MKVLINMNKLIRITSFILAWIFFVSVFLINFDAYAEILSILKDLGLVSTLFIYANLGIFNPLLAPTFAFSINMDIYLKVLSISIFTVLLVLLYKKLNKDNISLSKSILLLVFVLFSTSFLYRSYSLLVLLFIIFSFYSLKKLLFEGKSYLFLISFSLLVLSNWLLALATAVALLILTIYLVEDDKRFNLKAFKYLFINIFLSFGMAAFVFVPSYSVGAPLPSTLFSVSSALFLFTIIVSIYNFKTKQKRLSSSALLVFSLVLLFYDSLLLLPFLVLYFILFYDFVKEYNLDIREISLMIFFLFIAFAFSFTKDLKYPIIILKYSHELISENAIFKLSKMISFMALTISMIKIYVESSKMKIFQKR